MVCPLKKAKRRMSDAGDAAPQRRSFAAYVPIVLFVALVGVFALMLTREGRDTSAVPSALIGREAPQMTLPEIAGMTHNDGQAMPAFDPSLFHGKITVVNVWASWCVPCRDEHPFITKLSNDPRVQLQGINYKDKPANAMRFLSQYGNPYDHVGADERGRAAIDWGVYGIPETFLVGPDRVIRFKHAGPINAQILKDNILPLVDQLAGSSAQ